MNDTLSSPETVTTMEVRPTGVAARELPMGLVYDVKKVLEAHGLVLDAPDEFVALLMGLGQIVDAVAFERGGRRKSVGDPPGTAWERHDDPRAYSGERTDGLS